MEQYMTIQNKCLRILGHNFNSGIATGTSSIWRTIQQIFGLVITASASAPLIYYTIFHKSEIELATESFSIVLTNFLAVIKISTFLITKRKFGNISVKLKNMLKNDVENELMILKQHNNNAYLLEKAYLVSTVCTGLYFMLAPVTKFLYSKIIMNSEFVWELPMKMKFPFDTSTSPAYPIVSFYTGIVTSIVILYSIAIDGMFIRFSLNICAHFNILGNRIENAPFSYDEKSSKIFFEKFVDYHNLILDMCDLLCDTYKPIIFGQFLMTSLQMCVILYQLQMNIGNILNMLIYISYFLSIMIQLFIYCYGGHIITNENEILSNMIYLSNWYDVHIKYRKRIVILLIRSQTPVIIHAGFYEASLSSFMLILQAAMSYITLVQSIE